MSFHVNVYGAGDGSSALRTDDPRYAPFLKPGKAKVTVITFGILTDSTTPTADFGYQLRANIGQTEPDNVIAVAPIRVTYNATFGGRSHGSGYVGPMSFVIPISSLIATNIEFFLTTHTGTSLTGGEPWHATFLVEPLDE